MSRFVFKYSICSYMKYVKHLRTFNRGFLSALMLLILSCNVGNDKDQMQQTEAVYAEVMTLHPDEAIVEQSFPASLQGKDNVQLRPQISGYIDKIFMDEGAFVKSGQPLFRINPSVYQQQKNTSLAALGMAKSQLASAKLELEKYQVLTDQKVVADFQYQKALANYENAQAAVRQQQALVASADLNLGFSIVKAPISGYIGRIPNRVGALIGPNDTQALTTLSQVNEMYV